MESDTVSGCIVSELSGLVGPPDGVRELLCGVGSPLPPAGTGSCILLGAFFTTMGLFFPPSVNEDMVNIYQMEVSL